MGVRGCQTATKRNSKPNKAMKTSAPRRTKSISLHTLSYHDDWDSGCWNRGLALPRIGEHAMYLNLSAGKRASGVGSWPLRLEHRLELDDGGQQRVLGGWAGMVAGAAVGLSRFAVKKLEDEHLARVYHKPRPTRTPFTAESATAILVGGLLGATLCPVGRYWAGTACKGKVYHGTTSMHVKPTPARPFLLAPSMLLHPKQLLARALLGQWSAAAGTVAADVRHHPYGTQLFLPGYGWGRVEDDGGQTLGAGNVELYFSTKGAARRWGERALSVMSVERDVDSPNTPKRVIEQAKDEVVHVVEGGESMWELAEERYGRRGCSMEDVRVANSLTRASADFLRLGQRVRIPNCTGMPLDVVDNGNIRG